MGNHCARTLPVPFSEPSLDNVGERYHSKLESFITFETTDGDSPLRRFAQLPLPAAVALVAALADSPDTMAALNVTRTEVDNALVAATEMLQGIEAD